MVGEDHHQWIAIVVIVVVVVVGEFLDVLTTVVRLLYTVLHNFFIS